MSLEEAHKSRQAIFKEIVNSLKNSLKKYFNNPTLSEPDIIAELIWNLPQQFNKNLAPIFSNHGIDLKAGGVFVHASPKVKSAKFPAASPQSVEIGDLLILIQRESPTGNIDRWTLLLQAKKEIEMPPSHRNQNYLYAYWPEFEYHRSGSNLNGKKREITSPNLYNGAKYFFIGDETEDHLTGNFPKGDCSCGPVYKNGLSVANPAYQDLFFFRDFIYEFYELLFGNAGRAFLLNPPSRNQNWDQVITDLITITADRISKHMERAGQQGGGKRGQFDLFRTGYLTSDLSGQINEIDRSKLYGSDEEPPAITTEEPNNGISILQITMRDEGSDENQETE
jgi:hypothetical protein